jgi:hypothetical protein
VSWVVDKINNATHAVTIKYIDGALHDFIIPAEHQVSVEAKAAYIKTVMEAKALEKEAEAKVMATKANFDAKVAKAKKISPWAVTAASLLIAAGAILFAYLRMPHK